MSETTKDENDIQNLNKDHFEQTFQIADFARQSGENRRQYEFKIFISYVTLLLLGIYEGHHIEVPNDEYKELYGLLIVALLSVMHFFYIAWTISLSVANQNDGARRDFYLQKSECISRSLLMKFDDPLSQKLDNDYSKLCSNGKINIVPKFYEVWEYKNQLWINYAAALQGALPTIAFSLLVFNFSQKLWTGREFLVIVISAIVLPFILPFPCQCVNALLKWIRGGEGHKIL